MDGCFTRLEWIARQIFTLGMSSAVARISSDGQIDIITVLDNVVVGPRDGVIFTSHLLSGNELSPLVQVGRYSPAGELSYKELRLPENLSPLRVGGWKLIHVDDRERLYLFGGEEPGRAGKLLIYSNNGDLEQTASMPSDLLLMESRLESYSFWDVDSRGRILSMAETNCAKWRRESVPIWVKRKGL